MKKTLVALALIALVISPTVVRADDEDEGNQSGIINMVIHFFKPKKNFKSQGEINKSDEGREHENFRAKPAELEDDDDEAESSASPTPTGSPAESPTGSPTGSPSGSPTGSPSTSPTSSPLGIITGTNIHFNFKGTLEQLQTFLSQLSSFFQTLR